MTQDGASTLARARSVAALFLKLGFTAYGGPAAHVGMLEDEVVVRRKWLTRQEFLDLLGATNLIPGPNSTEMAIHIGLRQAGGPGLVAGGSCFILPAALIVTAIAWAYMRFGALPEFAGVLYGVKPVVMAVIVQALWRLGRTALKTWLLAAVGVAVAAANWLGVHELLALFAAGAAVAVAQALEDRRPSPGSPAALLGSAPLLPAIQAAGAAASAAVAFGLWPLFLFFLKVGAVLFGSGYVLLAFIRGDLVSRYHWLTDAQLFDAIAVGQVTPGPVFTTATFVGYILGGPAGAAVATAGIFLPAFFFVAISGPIVPRLRASRVAGAVLDGVNVGSLALMAVVTAQLARAAVVDALTVALSVVSAVLLIRFRVNSMWLALAGALIGLIAYAFVAGS